MKREFALTMLATAVTITAHVLISLMCFWIVERNQGRHMAEELFPEVNAHLSEEASEGVYFPLRDKKYVVTNMLSILPAFILGGMIARQGSRRAAAMSSGLVLAFLLWPIATGIHPAFAMGRLFQAGVALLGGCIGVISVERIMKPRQGAA